MPSGIQAIDRLQWGRQLSPTESRAAEACVPFGMTLLQWGRQLSPTESGGAGTADPSMSLLQWGRQLSPTERMSRGELIERAFA